MSTDLSVALFEIKRRESRARQELSLILLGSVLLCLVNLVLVLASPSIANAVALLGQY